jgi:hypothetical protein
MRGGNGGHGAGCGNAFKKAAAIDVCPRLLIIPGYIFLLLIDCKYNIARVGAGSNLGYRIAIIRHSQLVS